MKKLLVRLDAGDANGYGHAMRCISLARKLKKNYGIETSFCHREQRKLHDLVSRNGFQQWIIGEVEEEDALRSIAERFSGNVLLIDKLHPYGADIVRTIRRSLSVVMLHNECDGMYESDYAIFPSAHTNDKIVNNPKWKCARAELLHGPDYILINDEVVSYAPSHGEGAKRPRLVITTGANDPKNMLTTLVEWIDKSDIRFEVVGLVGFDHIFKDELQQIGPSLRNNISLRPFNLQDLFSARLVIAAFGVTVYECIYANVPLLTVGHIPKNAEGSATLQKRYGCNHDLGLFEQMKRDTFIPVLDRIWRDEVCISQMKKAQEKMIDGRGSDRIADVLFRLCRKEDDHG